MTAPLTPDPQRRKYNRRSTETEAPPYFEVFQRIATALEAIDRTLRADPAARR